MMKQLTYFGHSCFLLEADNGWKAVFDPYQDGSVPGLKLPALEADTVYTSHEHADHNAAQLIKITHHAENPYIERTLSTAHDEKGGALRGRNTVQILECGEEKIIHLGDLGCLLNKEQLNSIHGADILMIPCGGFYTIDAEQAKQIIEAAEPKTAVLMHYRTGTQGYDEIASKQDIQSVIPEAEDTGRSVWTSGQQGGILFMDACAKARTDGEKKI